MAASAPSLPAHRIGAYEIIGLLGAGGMGVVYEAVDRRLERRVALKFLSGTSDRAHKERLLREARAASALDHPNIATVYAAEEADDGRLFIVMAFCQGESLAERLRRGPLGAEAAIEIAAQVARGLEHAHRHGIVHRDIKPSNVMITREGVVKIVDFGLAHHLAPSESTQSSALSGTLVYMSPEQVMGQSADGRSDVWSLGVVLYQMVTGRLPFEEENPAATMMAILNAPPAGAAELGAGLQMIVERALAKDPKARYPSCIAMLEDMQRLGAGAATARPAVEAPKPAAIAQKRAWMTRRVRKYAVGVAMAAAIAIGAYWRFGPSKPAQPWHIAMLPAAVEGGNPAAQSLADGLMQRIGDRLSGVDPGQQSLWIVPAPEVRRRNVSSAEQARRELGANVAMQGLVKQEGDKIRVKIDLVQTSSMALLGSTAVEGDMQRLSSLETVATAQLADLMKLGGRPRAEGGERSPAAYESYLKGRGYLQRYDKSENLETAISLFESAVKADANFALGYAALGEAYWHKYQLEQNPAWLRQADAYCKRAVAANDQLPAVYVMLGRIHIDAQSELALAEFQRALQLEPRNVDALLGIAEVYEHVGRTQEAEQLYRQAAASRQNYWGGYQDLARFYFRTRQYDKAVAEFRHVVELTPDNAQAHSSLGTSLMQGGALAEAEAELKKSIALHPTYFAYSNLALVYYEQKRWRDAAAMLESALQLNRSDFRVWANLRMVYEWLEQPKKAEEASREELGRLQEAAALKPDDLAVQCELGLVHAKLHDAARAISPLQSALARAPRDLDVLVCAAEAYETLGNRKRALTLVNEALANGLSISDLENNPGLRKLMEDRRPHGEIAQKAAPGQ